MRSSSGSRALVIFVLFAFCAAVIPAPALHATMLQTGTVLENEAEETRAHLNRLLEKEEVRQALEDRGISVAEAQARVAALSDAQLHYAAKQMDSLPSGQGAYGIVGAVVLIFLILLITDIAGLTNVFPFVVDRR